MDEERGIARRTRALVKGWTHIHLVAMANDGFA